MKDKFIEYFMNIAVLTSKLSHAKRLKVGAIIIKDDRVISIGYNGMPAGWDNECEHKEYDLSKDLNGDYFPGSRHLYPYDDELGRFKLKTKPEVLHAESNAIAKVSRSTESSENATLFCTHAPCIDCAKLIYQAGISKVYYREQYRDSSGLEFLSQGDVDVHQCTNSI